MAKKHQNLTTGPNVVQHNLDAADEMVTFIKQGHQWALADRCTGSGKTFVMGEVVCRLASKKILVVGPSHAVLDGDEKTLKNFQISADYMTYQKLSKLNVMPTGYDCIIFDEAHHLEAPVWKLASYDLANNNPTAIFLGFTATTKRGDGIDISQTIFPGIATVLTFPQAWQRGILIAPYIVSTFFKVAGQITKLIRSELKKVGIHNPRFIEAEKASKELLLDWSRIKIEEAEIIKRHLPADAKKIVVFFENIQDLNSYKNEVEAWFKGAGFNPTLIEIHSRQRTITKTNNWKNINSSTAKGQIKVILSVDMLKEGVHIKDVEAVLFLRRTTSPCVFLQQIGRCMQFGQTRQPIIFDFVGNIYNQSIKNTLISMGTSVKTHNPLGNTSTTANASGSQNSTTVGNSSTIDEDIDFPIGGGICTNNGTPTNNTTSTRTFGKKQKQSFDLEIYEYNVPQLQIMQKFTTVCRGLADPQQILNELNEIVKSGDIERFINNPFLRRYAYNHSGKTKTKSYPECEAIMKLYKDYTNDPKNYVSESLINALNTGDYSKITRKDKQWMYNHSGKNPLYYHYPIVDILKKGYKKWQENQKNKN